jgi:hypothetical protein
VSFILEAARSQYAYVTSRYASTLIPRTRLLLETRKIGRENGLDPLTLKDALGAQRLYLTLLAFDAEGRDAPELHEAIVASFPTVAANLSLCSTLIRKGLLLGSLPNGDFSTAHRLCGEIPGAEVLVPFFSNIGRADGWRGRL